MRSFLLLALLVLSLPARADDKARIVGTWKLVAVTYEDAQTKERTPVLGDSPRGYQIATPEPLARAGNRQRPPRAQDRRGPRQGTALHDRL